MVLILFRSRLTEAAGADYAEMNAAMRRQAERFPGFVDLKSFTADDGERLTIVRWRDHDTLRAWREDPDHRAAQQLGRERWYEYYEIEVADLVRRRRFDRPEATAGPTNRTDTAPA
jgi:heme-degrading monooxygenase HmoA